MGPWSLYNIFVLTHKPKQWSGGLAGNWFAPIIYHSKNKDTKSANRWGSLYSVSLIGNVWSSQYIHILEIFYSIHWSIFIVHVFKYIISSAEKYPPTYQALFEGILGTGMGEAMGMGMGVERGWRGVERGVGRGCIIKDITSIPFD